MSTANVEIVRRVFEAIVRGGIAEVEDYFSEDAEWHTDPGVPEPGVIEGKAAVLAYVQGWSDALGDQFEVGVQDFVPISDDEVFGQVRFRWRPLGEGAAQADFDWCFIDTIRDGEIVRLRSFLDVARGRAAAGLDLPSPT